ncbi:hypothetical protein LTR42_010281 [Elasticomyces elasticus]|nr:hypothetical protein LTR42_010281 [Elasticomyces elasticus]
MAPHVPAAATVLKLPELLEAVLMRLPARDLLFAQKVCKAWEKAMDSSPSIQRALFFRPGTKADVEGVDLEHVILNPFLMQTYGESPSGWHKIDFIAPGARLQASCHKMFLSQPPTAFCLDYILVGATKTRCDELYGDFLGKPQLCTYAAVDKRIDVVMMRENLVAAQLVGSRIKFVKKQGSEGTKQ